MSRKNIVISIYANLPSGGAKHTYRTTLDYLSKKYKVNILKEPVYRINNFFTYLYTSLIKSSTYQHKLAKINKSDVSLCYQSWLVNSPSILRYLKGPKIYICHEASREFYDKEYIQLHNIKDKVINFIRLPIKYLDAYNAKSTNTTIIANSKFSKNNIDHAYGVNSIVVYPGIDVKKYQPTNIKKINQVVTVGSINRLKQQLFIVKVIANIPSLIRPKLLIISNGSNKDYLRKIKTYANANNVILKIRENIPESTKISELHKSKIFMFAPINEPFGLVVEEAIASGLPILVYSKGGGYSEVINNTNGVIIDNLDILDWSKHLQNMLNKKALINSYQTTNYNYALNNFSDMAMNNAIEKIILSKV